MVLKHAGCFILKQGRAVHGRGISTRVPCLANPSTMGSTGGTSAPDLKSNPPAVAGDAAVSETKLSK